MYEHAVWSKEYKKKNCLELAERLVVVREREVRLEEVAKAAETQQLRNESMTAQILTLSESNLSVARLQEMRRKEYEMLMGGGGGASAGAAADTGPRAGGRGLGGSGSGEGYEGAMSGGTATSDAGEAGAEER